jgi:PTH1 family peptidyl-tRNA hydrolase
MCKTPRFPARNCCGILFQMTWVIAGLGNPDDEHIHTRHNAGRMALEYFAKQKKLGEWKDEKKSRSFVIRGALGKTLVVGILPNTYMNKSGTAIAHYIKSAKAAEKLIVVYDELDLPLGRLKISYDRGSGGHNGVESVITSIKTRAFMRIRIGISPVTPSGATKKPEGEREVEKFILGEFKSTELSTLKAALKRAGEAIETIITEGREKAMGEFNS